MLAYSQIPWALGLHKLLLDYAEDVIHSHEEETFRIEYALNQGCVSQYIYSFTRHSSKYTKYVLFEIEDTKDPGRPVLKIKICKMHQYPYDEYPMMLVTSLDADWFDHLWMCHYITPDNASTSDSAWRDDYDVVPDIQLRSRDVHTGHVQLHFPVSEEVHFQNSLLHDIKEYEYFQMLQDYGLEFRKHPFCMKYDFDSEGNIYMDSFITSFNENDKIILDDVQDYVYNTFKSKLLQLFGER